MPSRVCPNPACPFRRKFHRPAEYQPEVEVCSDCDTRLVTAEVTNEEAAPLETLAVEHPSEQDLGSPKGDPPTLANVPEGLALPVVALISGAMILGHAFATHSAGQVPAVAVAMGAVLLGFGSWKLWTRDRCKRRIEPYDRGFVFHVDRRRVIVPLEQIAEPRVIHRVLRARRAPIGLSIELSFRFQEKWWVLSSFARARGEAFERWAEGICAEPNP